MSDARRSGPVLELTDVTKTFVQESGLAKLLTRDPTRIHAVNGVNLELGTGEVLGVVGESGCGKTTLAKTIARLHDPTDGEIALYGTDVSEYGRKEFYRDVQMIFQDPFKSLNGRMTVRDTLTEPLRVHDIGDRDRRIEEALAFARLTPPEQYLDSYPHELSGGERQRVAIASAIVLDPAVIIADEPVSMLDVSIRAGVMDLLKKLSTERDTSILYISHNLATVRYLCDEIAVMYLGKVVERGPTRRVISDPAHPYTAQLIQASPEADPTIERSRVVSERDLSDNIALPEGCYYKNRCPHRVAACDDEEMVLRDPGRGDERDVACHRAIDGLDPMAEDP